MRSVTVVIPVLDDADQLRACLASLAAQTVPPTEVIVVDNGSSDDSAEVARAAGAVVLHEPVRGIASAASRGYDAASGELIARVDSDSVLPHDWIARGTAWFGDPLVTAVTGPGRFRDLGRVAGAVWQVAYMGAYFTLMTAALGRPPLFGSNMLMRRSAWLAIRHRVHHDPMVHDDIDLSIQFDPTWRTVLDLGLVASVSSSPVQDPWGLVVRTRKAARTMRVSGMRAFTPGRIMRRVLVGTRPVRVVRQADRASDEQADRASVQQDAPASVPEAAPASVPQP